MAVPAEKRTSIGAEVYYELQIRQGPIKGFGISGIFYDLDGRDHTVIVRVVVSGPLRLSEDVIAVLGSDTLSSVSLMLPLRDYFIQNGVVRLSPPLAR